MNSPKRILASANDPGAANAIAPVLRALIDRGDVVLGIVTGPAEVILQEWNIPFQSAIDYSRETLTQCIDTFAPDIFVSGTSVGYSIDKQILDYVKNQIPSVYVVDLWNNYTQRFSIDGSDLAYMPRTICVMDDIAYDTMIGEGFPLDVLRITGNPYFEHCAKNISCTDEDLQQILYVSSPISSDINAGLDNPGFDEFTVLNAIIEAISGTDFFISIRLHPRDDPEKYNHLLSSVVRINTTGSTDEAVSRARIIIGAFSSVLLQALIAGKVVINYQPATNAPDPLLSNRLGLTHRVTTVDELHGILQELIKSKALSAPIDSTRLFMPNATANVIRVLDAIMV
jgi:hypothetical protein